MSIKRNVSKVLMFALAAILLLTVPMAAGAASTNGITTPKDGATVSGAVAVTGYASDPNFSKWQLDLLPGGDRMRRSSWRSAIRPATSPTR